MTKSKIELNKFFLLQLITALVVSFWLLVVGEVGAQQAPEFLVTWRALNYIPADYQGKILPSQSSRVEAGFDLISQNRIIDLSRSNILWFLNGELISSGIGLKTASFQINSNLNQTVRITVAEYEGNDLSHTFIIPVTNPDIVIDTKTPTRITRNQFWLPLANYTFEARPFFFNVNNIDELAFNWRINGVLFGVPLVSPNILDFILESEDAPRETEFVLSVGVKNISNQFEFNSKSINFLIN